MHKIIRRFAFLLLLAATGCHNPAPQQKDTTAITSYAYTDDYGSTIQVPAHPQRIVSLSPAVTEILFALHADSLLVGRTEFCTYPPQASDIENIGGISNLNIEKVLSVEPDLVISGSMVPQKVVKQFEDMGIPLVCVIEKQHFDALFDNIAKIGQLAGYEEQAKHLNDSLRAELAKMDLSAPQKPKSVYYVVGFGSGGNFTAGGNTFINDIITMAGGSNIARDSEGWTFSVEALMQADPDFILIRAEDSAKFCRTAPYNRLTAVKQGRTVALENGILDLQVPRNLEVIRRLRTLFQTR